MKEFYQIDATNKILGRFCSQIAKRALLGHHIVVTNAKKAIISGTKGNIHDNFLKKLNIRTATNPKKGPFHKRRPDEFMRRVIKQMLPRKKLRGKKALQRVHIYIEDIPERFMKKYPKLIEDEIEKADKTRLSYYNKFITLEDLCLRIGWNKKAIEV
jgi:large subunit ribosomal protein L13